ncbi:hypothetical protein Barb4_01863 [Bacteroidales bacterium Barb4]|nr:hypothetical protein Barb4_01863 [Bacteroidales bacterium Barb4]
MHPFQLFAVRNKLLFFQIDQRFFYVTCRQSCKESALINLNALFKSGLPGECCLAVAITL